MAEIARGVTAPSSPVETLLVVDAMTGQEAVAVAEEFDRTLPLTGLILTKIDGDARGGAALSIRAVTGVPIKFLGIGEKTDALELFHPDRLAGRILGMGDVLTLIEKAQESFDQKQRPSIEEKLRKGELQPRGLPRPAPADQEDGPARPAPGHDPGHGRRWPRRPRTRSIGAT